MRILEYPLVEEGALSGNDSFIVETSEGTKRLSIEELKNSLDISVTFPIGYVYTSFESTSPAELFGGSWLQLEDVFLRASNNLDTGGSDALTLTAAQMPSHSHVVNIHSCGSEQSGYGLAKPCQGYNDRAMLSSTYSPMSTNNSGSSGSFNNMPKYQNVYAWRRIS